MLKRVTTLMLTAALTSSLMVGCGGSSGGSNPGIFSVLNIIYLVSNRKDFNNTEGDGDIFSVNPATPGVLTNLTDNGSATGDSEDVACAVDLNTTRNRLFFASQRTDIRTSAGTLTNTTADVDIFTVGLLGGTITNVTDSTSAAASDRDDACVGLLTTGNPVFESTRVDTSNNANGDVDIFVSELTVGSTGVITYTISNRTPEDTAAASAGGIVQTDPAQDRVVYITSADSILFQSNRWGNDNSTTPISNNDRDQHIFSASATGTVSVLNLTNDGAINAKNGTTLDTDVFCGISGNSMLFQSNRNQGSSNLGQQAHQDVDIFLRDLGTTQTISTAFVNSAISNLTDAETSTAGHSSVNPQDENDVCNFGFGRNAITTATGTALGIFTSSRTATGVHRTGVADAAPGARGFLYFSTLTNDPRELDSSDLFSTTLVLSATSGVLNTITNLTDAATTGATVRNGDKADTFATICGTNLLFMSARTDLATTSSGSEDDIYAAALDGTSITNLTDGTSSSGDNNDVFLCCNSVNNRIAFISQRSDVGNATNTDVDLFNVGLSTSPGSITNMSDTSSGDGADGVSAITRTFESVNIDGTAASNPFATSTGFTVGFATVPSAAGTGVFGTGAASPRAVMQGISAGCVADNIVWTSNRTTGDNLSTDLDLFTTTHFSNTGSICTVAQNCIVNLTNSTTSSNDGNDFITSLNNIVLPPLTVQ